MDRELHILFLSSLLVWVFMKFIYDMDCVRIDEGFREDEPSKSIIRQHNKLSLKESKHRIPSISQAGSPLDYLGNPIFHRKKDLASQFVEKKSAEERINIIGQRMEALKGEEAQIK